MAPPTVCPSCGESAPPDANWCEACGADLAAAPAVRCVSCGQPGISDDGYCLSCGHKQPAERDHLEVIDGTAVGITDRGLRHHHNEDAVAVAELEVGGVGAVVCDGVSSTPGSAEASAAAAEAALAVMVEAGRDPDLEVEPVLLAATDAARQAATNAPDEGSGSAGPPSSTFVAALARPRGGAVQIDVAWLGDSRAYWVDLEGALQLTVDHEQDGSLTRWLGADGDLLPPEGVSFTFNRSGLLVVCSDGLWRYADPPRELHALIGRLIKHGADNDLKLGQELVRHAIDGGGHDNISVALWAWTAPESTDPNPTPTQPESETDE